MNKEEDMQQENLRCDDPSDLSRRQDIFLYKYIIIGFKYHILCPGSRASDIYISECLYVESLWRIFNF